MKLFSSNIFQLGIKELRGLARDGMLLLLIVYAFTFSLNAAICGAAGALISMIWVLQPYYGIAYSVRAFVIVTAAGLGNLPGVIVTAIPRSVHASRSTKSRPTPCRARIASRSTPSTLAAVTGAEKW